MRGVRSCERRVDAEEHLAPVTEHDSVAGGRAVLLTPRVRSARVHRVEELDADASQGGVRSIGHGCKAGECAQDALDDAVPERGSSRMLRGRVQRVVVVTGPREQLEQLVVESDCRVHGRTTR